jgi:hypothetical protein
MLKQINLVYDNENIKINRRIHNDKSKIFHFNDIIDCQLRK